MKIGYGNAIEAARFDDAAQILNTMMPANVNVQIKFHEKKTLACSLVCQFAR
jgi:hypothetical protein